MNGICNQPQEGGRTFQVHKRCALYRRASHTEHQPFFRGIRQGKDCKNIMRFMYVE